jgi:hypothetical protein
MDIKLTKGDEMVRRLAELTGQKVRIGVKQDEGLPPGVPAPR